MSLRITYEMAEKYSACGKGLKLLEQYPEGFTVDDVYSGRIKNIPMRYIAWSLTTFPYSEEELIKVRDYLKIIDSSAYYCCWDIKNCTCIEHSSHCEDAHDVKNSSDVTQSWNVRYGTDINESSRIYNSHFIYNSVHIGRSSNVTTSMYVFKSKNIENGFGIHNSENVHDSVCCDDCHNSAYLMFCRGLTDTQNRILCDEHAVGDYCIANVAVSQQLFEKVWNRLFEIIANEPYYYTIDLTNPDWSKITPSLVIWNNLINARGEMIKEVLPSIIDNQMDFLFSLIPSATFLL